MSGHDGSEFDAGYWQDRYANGQGASRRDPSPSLLAEVADLPPGRALEAGCGWGADALWLASRGWHVTAVDVAPAAVNQARRAAETADPGAAARITWTAADLLTWDPAARFDLVTSHYVHVPGPPQALVSRLASWVAPAGTLLVVGHEHRHGHGSHDDDHGTHGGTGTGSPPVSARLEIAQITSTLRVEDWQILTAEARTHTVDRPNGAPLAVLNDVVVRAQRNN